MLKIRFPLLSDHALNNVFQKTSAFQTNETSNLLIQAILENKENFYRNKSILYNTNRYCDHHEFNIMVIRGNWEYEKIVIRIDQKRNVTSLSRLHEDRENFASVCLNDEVYVFGGSEDDLNSISVKKYSPVADEWQPLADLDSVDRSYFSLCAFMNKIYIIAGWVESTERFDSRCIEFDAKSCKWKEVSEMKHARAESASAVFQGRVVACGGMRENNIFLNSVEVYDHVADKWSDMPSMHHGRRRHKLVPMKNKLFVFGGDGENGEVFDSACNKFVLLKPPQKSLKSDLRHVFDAVAMGSKVMIFVLNSPLMVVYDADTREWSEESCEVGTSTEDLHTSCLKLA